jgi:hypothetical protein
MTAVTLSLDYSEVPPDQWYSSRMKLFRFLVVTLIYLFRFLLIYLINAGTSETKITQYGEHTPPKIIIFRMFPIDYQEMEE